LEVLGAISAASSLLEAAIGIIGRIRKAHEQQKDLARILSGYHDELMNTKDIVRIVKDEEALQTATVVSQLVSIEALAVRFVDYLKTMDPGTKRPLRQLAHQLMQGSKEEKAIADIMNKLGHAKSSLSLGIQIANVGLTRVVGDTLVANIEVVHRVDLVLQKVLGEGGGLKLAELLKDRPAQDDGMVPLSDGDIACLSNEVASIAGDANAAPKPAANDPTSRIVIENLTEGQALQVNGPIGEKGWREVSHLEIRNNKAIGMSIQVNHAVSEEVFERMLAARASESRR